MRRLAFLVLALLALGLPASAWAQTGGLPPGSQQPAPEQPPPEEQEPPGEFQADRITILAVFKTIGFGEPSWVSGRFRHLDNPDAQAVGYRDRRLTLEGAPHPFATFTPLATTVTDREGYYSFRVEPTLHSRYRVVSADPAVTSDAKLIRVRIVVGLRGRDRAIRRGRSLEFSGTATPAHHGGRVDIQRRDVDGGRFRTVARTRLRAGRAGRSTYRRRVRIRESGVYRVRVSGDRDHLPGNSRALDIRVRR